MSDFRIHPLLTSPPVAAVVLGVVGMTLVDAGVADLLSGTGESPLDAETWGDLVAVRWSVGIICAGFGWFAWFLAFRQHEIRVPVAGVVLGIVGPLMALGLVWMLYQSIEMPEFAAAKSLIWRIAALWSALALLVAVGCARFGLYSYRMMRGQ